MGSKNSYSSELEIVKSILRETDSSKLCSTLILGFLGSGKTTFANQLINTRKDLKFAVIVENELPGKVQYQFNNNLQSYVASEGTIFRLIRSEIHRILDNIDTDCQINHLIVELADFSNPLPKAEELIGLTYLDSIISVIDSANVEIDLFNNRTTDKSEAIHCHIKYADVVLLNKVDLVAEAHLDILESKIRELRSDARILRCINGQVPLPLISRLGLNYIDDYYHYLEDNTVSLVVFESNKPFALGKFQYFLDNHVKHNIFRIIGILWFDESLKRHTCNISGKRFNLDENEWTSQPINQLVLVGQNLDAELLKSQLQKCNV